MPRSSDDFVCPYCHAPVPAGRTACPACGSDDETGWSDDPDIWEDPDILAAPEDADDDYEDVLEREGLDRRGAITKPPDYVLVVVLLVLGLIGLGLVMRM